MKTARFVPATAIAVGCVAAGVCCAQASRQNPSEITIKLRPTLVRGREFTSHGEGIWPGFKGAVLVDSKSYPIYVPDAGRYSTRNTGEDPTEFSNTSSPVFIDNNGDGQLPDSERWFSNFPVRIADRMFNVVRFAADGRTVVLKPSKTPLSGVIENRKCPPFSYVADDGKRRTLADYAGKALLIDVWSYT